MQMSVMSFFLLLDCSTYLDVRHVEDLTQIKVNFVAPIITLKVKKHHCTYSLRKSLSVKRGMFAIVSCRDD